MLTAQRVRPAPCVQANLNVPLSNSRASSGAQTVSSLLFAVPVLLGAFVGAPLLAREFESGTFRFAWTLFAFALAAFTGTLFRRTLPAMAVTLIVYIVLAIGTATAIRPHYETPVTTQGWNGTAGSAWGISSWVKAPDGRVLSQGDLSALSQHLPASVQNSASPDAFTNWLTQHGYTMWQSVQPDSRFWQFQLIEGGWLLVVSAALITGTVWLVRRRGA